MARRPLRSREDFVTAALTFVDANGAAGLSARSLAEAMGLDPMTIYRYFASMDDLAGSVIDHIFGLMLQRALPEGSPRERLAAHLASVQRAFLAHPNALALLVTSAGDQPNCDAVSRLGLRLLRDLGLSGRNLVVCHQMLETHVAGAHAFDLAGAPHHLEIRRQRRRRLDDPEVDRWNRTAATVGAINREAFALATEALIDRCVSLANA